MKTASCDYKKSEIAYPRPNPENARVAVRCAYSNKSRFFHGNKAFIINALPYPKASVFV